MTEPVTAQAFREAAARAEAWDSAYVAHLLLAASEQCEQLDDYLKWNHSQKQQTCEHLRQIATLTAERDEARAERDHLHAELNDLLIPNRQEIDTKRRTC